MFGTKGTSVESNSGNGPRAYFAPGIHVARIVDVEYAETAGGTPKIVLTFEGKPHGGDFAHPRGDQFKGSTASTDLWLTDKAMEITNQTLAYMADTLGFRDDLDAVTADSGEEYAAKLKPVLCGKVGRWKFAGEEIGGKGTDDNGKPKPNWFKTKLARYRFVEDISVSDDETKLKFDETNPYDMQRIPAADTEEEVDVNTAVFGAVESTDEEPW